MHTVSIETRNGIVYGQEVESGKILQRKDTGTFCGKIAMNLTLLEAQAIYNEVDEPIIVEE